MKGFGFIYGGGFSSFSRKGRGSSGQTEVYFRSNDVHESVLNSRHQGESLLSPGQEVEYYITAVTARGPLAACITLAGYTGVLPPSPGLLPENEYRGPDASHDENHIGIVKLFHAHKRHGFIRCKLDSRVGGKTMDYFFTVEDVVKPHFAGLALLLPHDVVQFRLNPDAQESSKGMHNHATEVTYLRPEKDIWSDDDDEEEEDAPSPTQGRGGDDANWRRR